jgi:hypothetical protein
LQLPSRLALEKGLAAGFPFFQLAPLFFVAASGSSDFFRGSDMQRGTFQTLPITFAENDGIVSDGRNPQAAARVVDGGLHAN